MAYHAAAAGGIEDRQARRLLRRAVAARQRLADTEEALGRVAAGIFGRCEQCGARVPEVLLAAAPESRYCARCAAVSLTTGAAVSLATGGGPAEAGTIGTGTTRAGTVGAGTAGHGAGRR